MSCPSHEELSIYTDAELELQRECEVESHLVQCRQCRGRVLALREESAVLRDLLQGIDRAPIRSAPPSTQVRGLAIGIAPALGVAALVATVGGWILETNLPSGTRWLNPIRLMGAFDMFIETIFMVRDRAPGLIELAIAVGALFSVASVLTFLVGSLSKRLVGAGIVLLVLGAGPLVAPPARAFQIETDVESLVIEAGETLSQSLIVSAKSVRIEGVIEGDLYALAEEITISGQVDGNVFAVGDRVEITGEVDDSLYVGGERVRIEGRVDDLYAFAEDLTIHERAVVDRDVAIFADRTQVDGQVGRDFTFYGESLEVRGQIGRNLITRADRMALLSGAAVLGDFDSRMPDGEVARVAPGVTIAGEHTDGVREHHHDRKAKWQDPGFYLSNLVLMVSAFLVGMALHALRPGMFETALPTATDFFRELGFGFVGLVVVPILIVICFLTVVAIPIGVMGLFLFITALFVSLIQIAALVGNALVGHGTGTTPRFGVALLVGLLIVSVAVNLPFVGGLIWIVAIMTGVGMLFVHVRDSYRLWST